MVESRWFNIVIISLILVNTVFLALEHHNMPKGLSDFLEVGNLVLTIVFAGEMILKMIGLGLREYFRDGFNIFDCLIVCIGLFEMLNIVDSEGITVLRTFRLLRIFKIVKSWTTLRKLL